MSSLTRSLAHGGGGSRTQPASRCLVTTFLSVKTNTQNNETNDDAAPAAASLPDDEARTASALRPAFYQGHLRLSDLGCTLIFP